MLGRLEIDRLEREQSVLELLKNLCGLEPLKKLFWSELNYDRVNQPLSRRGWNQTAANALAEDPVLFAGGGQNNDFHVVYSRLSQERLLLGQERPVVNALLKEHPYGLFIFSNEPQDCWHLVNVKYDEDEKKRRLFRRISVNSQERLRTAAERVAMLDLQSIQPDMFGLQPLSIQSCHDEAFDVEAVTRQFFTTFANIYHKVADDIATVPGLEQESGRLSQLLLDRLLFLYFIQKKGWLNQEPQYLYNRFQRYWRKDPNGYDYYPEVLYPLFLCVSNASTKIDSVGTVPFLNGGLFEENSRQTQAEAISQIRLRVKNSTFKDIFYDLLEKFNFTVTEQTPLDVEVAIDPEMLGRIFESLILQLEKDPDKDLRKMTGSYYTPRAVVHFMCQEALKEYLATQAIGKSQDKFEETKEHINKLLALPPADQLDDEQIKMLSELFTITEAKTLHQAILSCRICDPAVGSGAFPVGMLHEMVSALARLDLIINGKDALEKRNYDYDLKRQIIESCLYGVDIQEQAVRLCELRLWLSLIVDYQIDLTKPFSEAIREIPNLPNLSYRIVRGDSLLERLFGYVVQLDQLGKDDSTKQLIESIQSDKQSYFREGNTAEKRRMELKILAKQAELAERLIEAKKSAIKGYQTSIFIEDNIAPEQQRAKEQFDTQIAELEDLRARVNRAKSEIGSLTRRGNFVSRGDLESLRRKYFQTGDYPTFMWRMDFAEVFREKNGFDIVIENPPYGATLDEVAELIHIFYPYSTQRHKDSYKNFIELSLRIIHPKGIYSLITPNTFIRQPRYEDIRILLSHTQPIVILNLGENIFEESIVPVAISVGIKEGDIAYVRCADISQDKNVRWQQRSVGDIPFVPIRSSELFSDCRNGLNIVTSFLNSSCKPAKDFLDFKDAGINYQRINVGMKVKGDSDLSERLLYEGKRQSAEDYMYWKGSDINRFYMRPNTNRWCRSNYRSFILPGEVVRLNKDVFATSPKLLFRQTADRIISCLDRKGVWFGRSIIAAIPKTFLNEEQILFLLAALNSDAVSQAYRRDSAEVGRVFAQVKKARLEILPLPDPRQVDQNLVSNIAQMVREIMDLLAETNGDLTSHKYNELNQILNSKISSTFNSR